MTRLFSLPERGHGSYLLRTFDGDTLQTMLRHRELDITFAIPYGGVFRMRDALTDMMAAEELISQAQREAYLRRMEASFGTLPRLAPFADEPIESLHCRMHAVRTEVFGAEAISRAYTLQAASPARLDGAELDQRPLRDKLLTTRRRCVFALCEPAFLSQMTDDVRLAAAHSAEVMLLAAARDDGLLMTRAWLEQAGMPSGVTYIETDGERILTGTQPFGADDALFVYGEDGLLGCRKLTVDAVVTAAPLGFYAQATVNQLGCVKPCIVFVPRGFDIVRHVPLVDKTRMTYCQLAQLWHAHGESVYDMTAEELMRRYPQHFLDVYQGGMTCPAAADDYPIRVDTTREDAMASWLNSLPNVRYTAAFFDESMQPAPIPDAKDSAPRGILVHTVRISRAKDAQVIPCPPGTSPRSLFGKDDCGIASNFLFFMTPKLAALYNTLRHDRPLEQADVTSGHLDYMLAFQDGQRHETFPLFRKSCLALTDDGRFLTFRFRLGGGMIDVSGVQLRWEAAHVDADCDAPVTVHTPYSTRDDRDADRDAYRRTVGKGRVNLVILQDRIAAVRRGSVVLPSVGVVVSLDEAAAQPILAMTQPLEGGYYDPSPLRLTVRLDAPEGVDPALWASVRWAYGGGMTLMHGGASLDMSDTDAWFDEEGWMSPLSRQTQESALHTMAKHPRTAIGTAENGDLVIIVYSGRTWRSTGADYIDMCRIARHLHPDLADLMNADGGGSAVLGLVCRGSFMELSCPATSSGSVAGMVRPISTVFYIAAEQGGPSHDA